MRRHRGRTTHLRRSGLLVALSCLTVLWAEPVAAQVERVWLTHRTPDPSRIVVSWTTKTPGDSVVRFGPTEEYGQEVRIPGETTLHHVEIPLVGQDGKCCWSVRTGSQTSAGAFKTYPSDVLRAAIVADWQSLPNLDVLKKDDIHILFTAGDNIAALHPACGVGKTDCIAPYLTLIDRYPELFRSTPFMPILGNHDREIRPRGPKPPAEPVYDVDATAFRRTFELPGDEWYWHFDVPRFDLRVVALDLHHTSDAGTTWQTGRPFGPDSAQLAWYRERLEEPGPAYVVTLQNERNSTARGLAGGSWGKLMRQGSLVVSGFGYFAERAEVDGFPFLNTSLGGHGAKYPDPKSQFFASEDNYILLTARREPRELVAEIRKLDGTTLDRRVCSPRPARP